MFTLVDLILIVVVLVFVIVGFMMGLIKSLGALVGVFAGAWVAGHYYEPVASWLTPVLLGHSITATIVAFVLIFGLVDRLVIFIFYLIDKIFNIIAIIPFLGSINKLAGALLGFAEGVLATGLLLYVVSRFAGSIPWVGANLGQSQVAHGLVWISGLMTGLLPEALEKMASIF